jgi:hypothetical protein
MGIAASRIYEKRKKTQKPEAKANIKDTRKNATIAVKLKLRLMNR